MLKISILCTILLSFLTSCSLETKTEDSNRYEIAGIESNYYILLDKKTGESWTGNMGGSITNSTLKATWIKNIKN